MRKNFILDTNVVLHEPRAIFQFEDNDVILPIYVVEELDQFKKDTSELGRNARQVARYIDQYREKGSLSEGGVELPNGGKLRVLFSTRDRLKTELFHSRDSIDNKILAVALTLRDSEPDIPAIVISKDTNLRIRANALGLTAVDYEPNAITIDELYTGTRDYYIPAQLLNKLFEAQELETQLLLDFLKNSSHPVTPDAEGVILEAEVHQLFPNQFVQLIDNTNPQHTAVARVEPDGFSLKPLTKKANDQVWGIRARNKEQRYALSLLLDDRIKLVTLVGKAGTGKTLLALAAGMQQAIEEEKYQKLLVSRPVFPLGRDLGFLPGTMEEKLLPWMQPIFDNVELLVNITQDGKRSSSSKQLMEMGMLQIEPLTYIRGRSIPQQFMVVDECFPYQTPIVTEEGPRQIGALFSNWIRGGTLPRVRSFDENSEKFVWKKITQMWHRGQKPLVEVHLSNRKVRCTANHPFRTHRGWVAAAQLQDGDLVYCSHPEEHQVLRALTEDQNQLFLGSFLGDGGISQHGTSRYRLRITHGKGQEEYCKWKASLFSRDTSDMLNSGYNPDQAKITFSTKMVGYHKEFPCPKTHCPQWVLEDMNVRGLAIWFMDDGSAYTNYNGARIHTESFDEDSIHRMILRLQDFDIDSHVMSYRDYQCIRLRSDAYYRLSQLIAPWCHTSMAYKLHPDHKHLAGTGRWDNTRPEWGYVAVKGVTSVEGLHHVFDMEVEDTHTFLIPSPSRGKFAGRGAIVVHNSQNLTPHEVKTIISRAGEGTKIILTGDPYQIDHPYIDASDNGLVHVVKRFQQEGIAGHITLQKGERSELAEKAANLL